MGDTGDRQLPGDPCQPTEPLRPEDEAGHPDEPALDAGRAAHPGGRPPAGDPDDWALEPAFPPDRAHRPPARSLPHAPALGPSPAQPGEGVGVPHRPVQGRWSDERIELWIGTLLRAGVVLAAAVAAVGAFFFVLHYGAQPADYRTFHGVPAGLDSVEGVLAGALALRSRWIIQLGLLLLIATPIARVALSLVAFLLQRDRTYVVVSTIVLALLLLSLMGPGL